MRNLQKKTPAISSPSLLICYHHLTASILASHQKWRFYSTPRFHLTSDLLHRFCSWIESPLTDMVRFFWFMTKSFDLLQKTDGALAQSRRGFHVELGAREKAVSIFYIYLCFRVGIDSVRLNCSEKEKWLFSKICFGRIFVSQIVIVGSVIVLKSRCLAEQARIEIEAKRDRAPVRFDFLIVSLRFMVFMVVLLQLLAEDSSLRRFKSHKKGVHRLKRIGDVLTVVVVAGMWSYFRWMISFFFFVNHLVPYRINLNLVVTDKVFRDSLLFLLSIFFRSRKAADGNISLFFWRCSCAWPHYLIIFSYKQWK